MPVAYFAAGCFWGVEAELQEVPGVIDAASGYQGGRAPNPTYESVCEGNTGHAETVRVTFDAARITYEQLLKWYFDRFGLPPAGRRADTDGQYRAAVFAADEAQLTAARTYVEARYRGRDVTTQIAMGGPFWEAEAHHQNYYAKHR